MTDAADITRAGAGGPGRPVTLASAELLHECFCRAREAAKRLRFVALVLEIIVVGITGWRIVRMPDPGLLPLLIVFVTVAEVLTRHMVGRLRSYGQGCRRLVMRAYADEIDIGVGLAGLRRSELPSLAILLTPSFTWPTLVQYYDFADAPKGPVRLRAICAYSAFFSSRLMSSWSAILLMVLILVAAGGTTMLYNLATSVNVSQQTRNLDVDALLTVVWCYAAIRVFEAVIETRHLGARYQRLFELLERTRATDGQALLTLVEDYDFDRASGLESPTILFRIMDKRLEKDWNFVRVAFLDRA